MAAFAHIFISLMLSYFLMKISNGKFTAKHAIIFSVNSHFGPDIFGFLDMEGISFYFYMFFHGYGWILAAFIVAIPWWRAAQYQMDIDIPKRVFNIQKREEGDPLKMEYLVVYCLVAGGGIMHLFVDLIHTHRLLLLTVHPNPMGSDGSARFMVLTRMDVKYGHVSLRKYVGLYRILYILWNSLPNSIYLRIIHYSAKQRQKLRQVPNHSYDLILYSIAHCISYPGHQFSGFNEP